MQKYYIYRTNMGKIALYILVSFLSVSCNKAKINGPENIVNPLITIDKSIQVLELSNPSSEAYYSFNNYSFYDGVYVFWNNHPEQGYFYITNKIRKYDLSNISGDVLRVDYVGEGWFVASVQTTVGLKKFMFNVKHGEDNYEKYLYMFDDVFAPYSKGMVKVQRGEKIITLDENLMEVNLKSEVIE